MIAKTWGELEVMLKATVEQAMHETVAPLVKELESKNVEKYVYNVYPEPTEYERRGNDGGLADVRNMTEDVKIVGNSVEMTVTNNTKSNPDFLPYWKTPVPIAPLVEYGMDYDYPFGENPDAFTSPREFTKATEQDLRNGKFRTFLVIRNP